MQNIENVNLVSLEELLDRSDIVVGLVRHNQFLSVSRAQLEGKVVFDTCGMFS